MKERGRLVIIGAGIVGCSAAYYLAKMGWDDILVLEQGPLFQTGGSTSHAPGLVFQTNASRTMTKLSQYSVKLYSELEAYDRSCFYPVGSMEVAFTEERWEDLKRKRGHAMSWGLDAGLITPEEAKSKLPLLDDSKILGAYFVPSDGLARGVWACEAMARSAQEAGVTFRAHAQVTGIEVGEGGVRAVRSGPARIEAPAVLLCAGIWGPTLARSAGVSLPLTPVQHPYAVTEPLPELEGEMREVVHPILRHQDRSIYLRQHADSYGIGSYLHEPLLVDSDQVPRRRDPPLTPATMEFTPQHFERGLAAAGELLPTLKGRRLAYTMNGLFSFTPDGLPVLGESREVRGLWVAEGVWITHAGGVGKAMAEWMTEGAPSLDLRECDINRFHPHALTQDYIRARGAQQYREVYDVIHPLQQIGFPRNLRLSPFHGRMEALGAFFFESAGWERPQWFESNTSLLCERDTHTRSGWESKYWSPTQGVEHRTTRESVAMFDLTPFAKVEVRGAGALEYLQRLCANQIDQPVGSVVYTSMLNQRGGIVADLTVSRLGDDRFLVVRGGAMGLHDLAWMLRHLPQDGSVQLTDVTSSYCCIGLWGPRARDLAGRLTADDLSSSAFPSFTAKRVDIGNIPALALRVSYVGEAGWEIYTQTNYGAALWDALWDAGRPFGLAAAGGGAFDSLRLEKGYRLWGSDIHSEYNPLEAGLGFAVNFDKGDFLGREALLEAKDLGLTRKLSRLYFDEPDRVVMGKEPIIADDRVVGYVTSSNYGYTLGKGIAYGNLPIDLAKEGERVEVYYFGEMHPATVMREPR